MPNEYGIPDENYETYRASLDDEEPDTDMINENMWELYVNWCHERGWKPDPKGFTIWLDERYD